MEEQPRAALSRRFSLGVSALPALLAMMAGPSAALAATSKKKDRRKARKLKKKKCKRQVGQCRTFWTGLCQGDPDCVPLIDCCDSFASCNTEAALSCLFPPPTLP